MVAPAKEDLLHRMEAIFDVCEIGRDAMHHVPDPTDVQMWWEKCMGSKTTLKS